MFPYILRGPSEEKFAMLQIQVTISTEDLQCTYGEKKIAKKMGPC